MYGVLNHNLHLICVCDSGPQTSLKQWRSQDVFIGVAHKSSLFQYKNVVDYKVLDYFSV